MSACERCHAPSYLGIDGSLSDNRDMRWDELRVSRVDDDSGLSPAVLDVGRRGLSRGRWWVGVGGALRAAGVMDGSMAANCAAGPGAMDAMHEWMCVAVAGRASHCLNSSARRSAAPSPQSTSPISIEQHKTHNRACDRTCNVFALALPLSPHNACTFTDTRHTHHVCTSTEDQGQEKGQGQARRAGR